MPEPTGKTLVTEIHHAQQTKTVASMMTKITIALIPMNTNFMLMLPQRKRGKKN